MNHALEFVPGRTWLMFQLGAVAVAVLLALAAQRGRRALWICAGLLVMAALAFSMLRGSQIYLFHQDSHVIFTDALLVAIDALLVATLLTVPRRHVRFSMRAIAGAVLSVGFLTFSLHFGVA